jgi:DNA helicase HerA-like ATPase
MKKYTLIYKIVNKTQEERMIYFALIQRKIPFIDFEVVSLSLFLSQNQLTYKPGFDKNLDFLEAQKLIFKVHNESLKLNDQLFVSQDESYPIEWMPFREASLALSSPQEKNILQLGVQFISLPKDDVEAIEYDAEFIKRLQEELK